MGGFRGAIVVGASSGIGAAVSLQLAKEGCHVAALGRRSELLDELAAKGQGRVLPFRHDVTAFETIPEAFARAAASLPALDLLLYSAGVMLPVGQMEFDFEKDARMVQVNLLGAIAWMDEGAKFFAERGNGCLSAIGSVAGDRGRRGNPVYNASKAGLATYMEALRNRLAPLGISVSTFKPGPVATAMTDGKPGIKAMPVERAAEIIVAKAAVSGEHYLKLSHRVAFAAVRMTPSWIFRRLKL